MLPAIEDWDKTVSNLGISNNDRIIVYDNSDVISACRCWYTFIYFGHDPKLISVLDGGFKKWKKENREISKTIKNVLKSDYKSEIIKKLLKNKKDIEENILKKEFIVVDARSRERFEGKVPDPRSNVRSGCIPQSICLPYKEIINKDNSFKNRDELEVLFKKTLKKHEDKPVFSCGSGVTACVLALAYSLVNTKYHPVIYDGSWSEYGRI